MTRVPASRILVASLWHEAHSFSPLLTRLDNFVVLRGEAMLEKAASSGSGLGGAMRRFDALGAVPIPVLSAVAPPGGLVVDAVFAAFRDEIVAAARAGGIDGIYLDLHGSVAAESVDDCEGALAEALRDVVGSNMPIAASFDLHGSMTPRLLSALTIGVACKNNPHDDYHLAGDRAASLLVRTIRGEIRPVMAASWVPAILRGKQETGYGPLRALHVVREQLAAADPALLDLSLFNTHSQLDAAPHGQCVLAVANDDPAAAATAARSLAEAVWRAKEEFTPDLPAVEDVLSRVTTAGGDRPIILGDFGDRVLAGAPGDSTSLPHLLVGRWKHLRALVPVTDPNAVRIAMAAGEGAQVELALGATWSRHEPPVSAVWRVLRLSDGRFVQRGPFLANEPAELGDCALLQAGNLTVLATTVPGLTQDPEAFLCAGADPASYDVVVAKSGYHFKLAFASIGDCVTVDTPGMSTVIPGAFNFGRRPAMWPDVADLVPDLTPQMFGSGGAIHSGQR